MDVNAELEKRIADRLRTVIDPETGVDVMRMRLVEDLEADEEGTVQYTFRPSSPFCPLAVTLGLDIKRAVAGVTGVAGQAINVKGYVDAESLAELLNTV